jgi:ADP-heptose:LPS heptosyltransferase
MGEDAVDLTGKLELMTAAALIAESDLMISNDSGLMHLAAAVNTNVIGLFGPTSPKKNAPWAKKSESTIFVSQMDCAPCHKAGYLIECDHVSCMRDINEDKVFNQAVKMLNEDFCSSESV